MEDEPNFEIPPETIKVLIRSDGNTFACSYNGYEPLIKSRSIYKRLIEILTAFKLNDMEKLMALCMELRAGFEEKFQYFNIPGVIYCKLYITAFGMSVIGEGYSKDAARLHTARQLIGKINSALHLLLPYINWILQHKLVDPQYPCKSVYAICTKVDSLPHFCFLHHDVYDLSSRKRSCIMFFFGRLFIGTGENFKYARSNACRSALMSLGEILDSYQKCTFPMYNNRAES